MIPETLYEKGRVKVKMGGQTKNISVVTTQLQTEARSAVRFNLSGRQEDTPGISASAPLTVVGAENGNAWVFFWEEDHLLNLFSLVGGTTMVSLARMSEPTVDKLRESRETITVPFKRGERMPNKCTRVYRIQLASDYTPEAHEIRVLAYHFPDTSRDYLRVNFLKQQPGSNDWNIEPIVEVLKVHGHPTLRTGLLIS